MLTAVPEEIQHRLSSVLQVQLIDFSFSAGGCINHGGKLTTSRGNFFLKWNSATKFPGMFDAEARGLKILRDSKVIHIPEVIASDQTSSWQFIVMEFVDERPAVDNYWEALGMSLSNLHHVSSEFFGLDHSNYIGSLPQYNTQNKIWTDFFILQRLIPQIELATTNNRIDKIIRGQFEMLFKKLPGILPSEKPSLLHGDLWSGNLITDVHGNPCLIDPAVYFGHREAEIAFTKLFGGFSHRFYESYQNYFPLLPGFKQRSEVYNLYPLMVHVNLFGGGYVSQVVSILKRFV